MAKRAEFTAKRTGNSVLISIDNFEAGDRWNLFRSKTYNGALQMIVESGATSTYTDTVGTKDTPKYALQYEDDSGLKDLFDQSERVFNSATQLFSRLPIGVVSPAKFTL